MTRPVEGEARVRLDSGRQVVRLAFGLVVLLGLVAVFVTAALVTADSTAKRAAAWVIVIVLLGLTGFVVAGGRLAMRRQSIVVSGAGIAREAAAQPWQVVWSELEAVTVEQGWHRANVSPAWRPRVWRVTLRLVPRDAESFAMLHPPLAVYRGRFGARHDEFAVFLGPVRELTAPLDAALRTFGGPIYRGTVELGQTRPGEPR